MAEQMQETKKGKSSFQPPPGADTRGGKGHPPINKRDQEKVLNTARAFEETVEDVKLRRDLPPKEKTFDQEIADFTDGEVDRELQEKSEIVEKFCEENRKRHMQDTKEGPTEESEVKRQRREVEDKILGRHLSEWKVYNRVCKAAKQRFPDKSEFVINHTVFYTFMKRTNNMGKEQLTENIAFHGCGIPTNQYRNMITGNEELRKVVKKHAAVGGRPETLSLHAIKHAVDVSQLRGENAETIELLKRMLVQCYTQGQVIPLNDANFKKLQAIWNSVGMDLMESVEYANLAEMVDTMGKDKEFVQGVMKGAFNHQVNKK